MSVASIRARFSPLRLPMLGRVWKLGRATLREYQADGGSLLSAAIALYGILAIAPLTLIVVLIARPFIGERLARREMFSTIETSVGPSAAHALDKVADGMLKAQIGPEVGLISVLVIVYATGRLFSQLQLALNTTWNLQLRPRDARRGTAKTLIWRRFLSFLLVSVLGLLLLISVLFNSVIHAIANFMPAGLPSSTMFYVADLVTSLMLGTLAFAAVFKVVPDARVRWSDVWLGAAVTSGLFLIGRLVMGWYFSRSALGNGDVFGALLVLALWAQYCAQVLVLGAEFTQVIASERGGLEPYPYAESWRRPAPTRNQPSDATPPAIDHITP